MAEPFVDLRSDTVTRPTPAMRRAMAEAEVGDDVFGEDPTVARLEAAGAAALGREAALFVPSGTMGNQIALHLHARPGSEVICDRRGHVVLYEMGAMAAISGLLPHTVETERGLLTAAQVEAAISPDVTYKSRTGVVVIENTHNMAGGTVYPRPRIDEILAVARRRGLPVHLDGARLFNAATALGTTAADLAAGFESVMISLSKALGAPVGSLLAGDRAFVHEARRVRKMLGGGMRQAGILAAAGLIALEEGPSLLARDHENAAWLAGELAAIPGLATDPAAVATNIVMVRVTPALFGGETPDGGLAAAFLAKAREAGLLAVPISPETVRLVTHRDAPRERIEPALTRLRTEISAG